MRGELLIQAGLSAIGNLTVEVSLPEFNKAVQANKPVWIDLSNLSGFVPINTAPTYTRLNVTAVGHKRSFDVLDVDPQDPRKVEPFRALVRLIP